MKNPGKILFDSIGVDLICLVSGFDSIWKNSGKILGLVVESNGLMNFWVGFSFWKNFVDSICCSSSEDEDGREEEEEEDLLLFFKNQGQQGHLTLCPFQISFVTEIVIE
ncbi:hypothetical protein Dsin_032201 [Dipteronia sinensis]|uniref:Uncharacterized protein n=1 Tax=Dipteronia sinensis TaxID=43782 RepID=A0AAD9ZN00_9ROSI|nr:hypothetical protein Dsin_032201 [Dipteronia sinensis]